MRYQEFNNLGPLQPSVAVDIYLSIISCVVYLLRYSTSIVVCGIQYYKGKMVTAVKFLHIVSPTFSR